MEAMEPIEARSIQEQIQERIKSYILRNKLRAGDPLPTEAQFVDQLRVSRTVVREALRALESLGVVRSQRGEGRYVNKFNLDPILQNMSYGMLFDYDDMQEVLDVRERLEIAFIPDAIAAMDQPTLDELRRLVQRMLAIAATGETFWEEDIEFHRRVYSRTGNRFLIKLLDVFWHVYTHQRDEAMLLDRDPQDNARSHGVLLEALEARDVELARKLVVEHFAATRDLLRGAHGRVPDGDNGRMGE